MTVGTGCVSRETLQALSPHGRPGARVLKLPHGPVFPSPIHLHRASKRPEAVLSTPAIYPEAGTVLTSVFLDPRIKSKMLGLF